MQVASLETEAAELRELSCRNGERETNLCCDLDRMRAKVASANERRATLDHKRWQRARVTAAFDGWWETVNSWRRHDHLIARFSGHRTWACAALYLDHWKRSAAISSAAHNFCGHLICIICVQIQ
jgi:hypothetical protein